MEDSGVREIRNCRELKITPARWRKDNKKFKKERKRHKEELQKNYPQTNSVFSDRNKGTVEGLEGGRDIMGGGRGGKREKEKREGRREEEARRGRRKIILQDGGEGKGREGKENEGKNGYYYVLLLGQTRDGRKQKIV